MSKRIIKEYDMYLIKAMYDENRVLFIYFVRSRLLGGRLF